MAVYIMDYRCRMVRAQRHSFGFYFFCRRCFGGNHYKLKSRIFARPVLTNHRIAGYPVCGMADIRLGTVDHHRCRTSFNCFSDILDADEFGDYYRCAHMRAVHHGFSAVAQNSYPTSAGFF